MRPLALTALVLASFAISPSPLAAPEFGVNLYGFSYHIDRKDINGHDFNETNSGIGFRATIQETKRSTSFVEVGYFQDSFDHGARYVSVAYQFKLTQGIHLGLNLGYYDAPSVLGQVIAPIPTLTFRYRFVALNLVHMPGFSGLNPYPSFGGYMTFFVLQG